MQLVLASASPRRAALLKQVGLPFQVQASTVDEDKWPRKESLELLALAKARAVADTLMRGIVLGADTIVICHEQSLGKPAGEAEAKKMLKLLSGEVHEVITGVALIRVNDGLSVTCREKTEVKFRNLGDEEINHYVSTGEPFDKAGAYGIQGKGALLVQKIHGCYSNVVGLPLVKVFHLLQELGYSPWLEVVKEAGIDR